MIHVWLTTIKFAYFEAEVYTDDINYIPVNAISDSWVIWLVPFKSHGGLLSDVEGIFISQESGSVSDL